MDYSYQRSHYPPQYSEPSRFQAYNHQPYNQYQQNPVQHQYASYYSNTYPHQPPIHQPVFSSQPSHVQLPNAYIHFPQMTAPVLIGRDSWYPQARGLGPFISGPCLGSGVFPGPSGLLSHVTAGQSLDKGGGGQCRAARKAGGSCAVLVKGKTLSKHRPAELSRCELCKVDCGSLEQHESGKKHRRELKKSKANANITVVYSPNKQKPPSGDLKKDSTFKPDNLLVEEETKKNLLKNVPLENKAEEKINDLQQADSPKHANGELLAEKTSMSEEVARPSVDNQKGDAILRKEKISFKQRHAGAGWCDLCKVGCGSLYNLELHEKGSKHRRKNLEKLEANASRSVPDFKNEQTPPSGDLKQETSLKPGKLLVEEETKQNLPKNIPLDGAAPAKNKLEGEQKIKKPMMNQIQNPKRGIKRKRVMCYLCNLKCNTREILSRHLLGKEHISRPKHSEFEQAIYGRLGLRALYPPCPVTQTLCSLENVQQAFNDVQVSGPVASLSILPQTDNAVTRGSIQGLQSTLEHKEPVHASVLHQINNAATGDSIPGSQLTLEHKEPVPASSLLQTDVAATVDSVQGSQSTLEHKEPLRAAQTDDATTDDGFQGSQSTVKHKELVLETPRRPLTRSQTRKRKSSRGLK